MPSIESQIKKRVSKGIAWLEIHAKSGWERLLFSDCHNKSEFIPKEDDERFTILAIIFLNFSEYPSFPTDYIRATRWNVALVFDLSPNQLEEMGFYTGHYLGPRKHLNAITPKLVRTAWEKALRKRLKSSKTD